MNEHQKVSYFNRGKTSIHTIFQVQVKSTLSSGLFVGQNGGFSIMPVNEASGEGSIAMTENRNF